MVERHTKERERRADIFPSFLKDGADVWAGKGHNELALHKTRWKIDKMVGSRRRMDTVLSTLGRKKKIRLCDARRSLFFPLQY